MLASSSRISYASAPCRTLHIESVRGGYTQAQPPSGLALYERTSFFLLTSSFSQFAWRELLPCWDTSSDLLNYACGWFVCACLFALIISTVTMNAAGDGFVGPFLVALGLSIIGLIFWLGARHDEIDMMDEAELEEAGNSGGVRACADAGAGASASADMTEGGASRASSTEGPNAWSAATANSSAASAPESTSSSSSFLARSRKTKAFKRRRRGFGVSLKSSGAAVAPAPRPAAPQQLPEATDPSDTTP